MEEGDCGELDLSLLYKALESLKWLHPSVKGEDRIQELPVYGKRQHGNLSVFLTTWNKYGPLSRFITVALASFQHGAPIILPAQLRNR